MELEQLVSPAVNPQVSVPGIFNEKQYVFLAALSAPIATNPTHPETAPAVAIGTSQVLDAPILQFNPEVFTID